MARILGVKKAEIRFADRRSGSVIVLRYTEPTTEQLLGFQNECLQRMGKAVISRRPDALLKYGKQILSGFGDGSFQRLDDSGKAVAISCDNASPDYMADWRKWVEDYAADLIQLLAQEVFESATSLGGARVSEDAESD